MSTKRTIVPGQIEGFLAGCPFCATRRKGPAEVGARFRIITGYNAGQVGIVVKVTKLPSGEPIWPYEILAHMDDDPSHIQRRILFKLDVQATYASRLDKNGGDVGAKRNIKRHKTRHGPRKGVNRGHPKTSETVRKFGYTGASVVRFLEMTELDE
jgi:hypothetical protein